MRKTLKPDYEKGKVNCYFLEAKPPFSEGDFRNKLLEVLYEASIRSILKIFHNYQEVEEFSWNTEGGDAWKNESEIIQDILTSELGEDYLKENPDLDPGGEFKNAKQVEFLRYRRQIELELKEYSEAGWENIPRFGESRKLDALTFLGTNSTYFDVGIYTLYPSFDWRPDTSSFFITQVMEAIYPIVKRYSLKENFITEENKNDTKEIIRAMLKEREITRLTRVLHKSLMKTFKMGEDF